MSKPETKVIDLRSEWSKDEVGIETAFVIDVDGKYKMVVYKEVNGELVVDDYRKQKA